MADQQLAMEIVARDLATATLQKVDGALLSLARSQGTATAATQRATVASGDFRVGLSKASNAITNLAGDALGANNKVANLAEGLLSMVAGGAVVTGVAAGITLVAGALFYFSKQAREAKAAYDAYLESLTKDTPLAIVGAQLDAMREKVGGMEVGLAFRQEDIDAAKRELAALEAQYQSLLAGFAPGRQEARDDAAKARAKEAERLAREADKNAILNGIRNPMGNLPAIPAPQNTTGIVADPIGLRTGDFTAQLPAPEAIDGVAASVGGLSDVFADLGNSMGFVADATIGIGEGLMGLGEIVGGGFGETAKKLIAPFAKIEGAYFTIKGLAKIAESIFPPNPAGLASGTGMVARGRQLLALGGGGGSVGGVSGASVGAGSGQSARDSARTTAERQGTVTVVWPRDAFANPADPRFQEMFAETIRRAGGRNITFAPAA